MIFMPTQKEDVKVFSFHSIASLFSPLFFTNNNFPIC